MVIFFYKEKICWKGVFENFYSVPDALAAALSVDPFSLKNDENRKSIEILDIRGFKKVFFFFFKKISGADDVWRDFFGERFFDLIFENQICGNEIQVRYLWQIPLTFDDKKWRRSFKNEI